MEENAKLYGGGGSGVHGHEEETDQSSPHSQNHRHIKLKQKLIYELSLKIEGTETKIEIQEGDSISEIVEHLALQYKLSKDFQDALEIYIDRKLQNENLAGLVVQTPVTQSSSDVKPIDQQ